MSLVRDEIAEQPVVLERMLEHNRPAVEGILAALERRPPRYIVIAARGSSANAARYALHLFGLLDRLPVMLSAPSLHTVYAAPPRLEGALVLGISQSGESPDVVSVVAEGTRQGQLTVAITNEPSSPLADAARHAILLEAGPERSVAATKTYTASLAAIAELAAAMAGHERLRAELRTIPAAVASQLVLTGGAEAAVEAAATWQRCAVVGRGANHATAFEAALKIKELTAIASEPYSPADFMHGPIAVVENGYPVVAVAPLGPARAAMEELLTEVRRRGGEPLILSNGPELALDGELVLQLGPVPEWLSPIAAVVPAQLLAVGIAERRGVEVDRPFGLSKVTLTR